LAFLLLLFLLVVASCYHLVAAVTSLALVVSIGYKNDMCVPRL
jgi:hypothetical protein